MHLSPPTMLLDLHEPYLRGLVRGDRSKHVPRDANFTVWRKRVAVAHDGDDDLADLGSRRLDSDAAEAETVGLDLVPLDPAVHLNDERRTSDRTLTTMLG